MYSEKQSISTTILATTQCRLKYKYKICICKHTHNKNEKATKIMFCECNENQGLGVQGEINHLTIEIKISGCVRVES